MNLFHRCPDAQRLPQCGWAASMRMAARCSVIFDRSSSVFPFPEVCRYVAPGLSPQPIGDRFSAESRRAVTAGCNKAGSSIRFDSRESGIRQMHCYTGEITPT